jgi:hypothetical protein
MKYTIKSPPTAGKQQRTQKTKQGIKSSAPSDGILNTSIKRTFLQGEKTIG